MYSFIRTKFVICLPELDVTLNPTPQESKKSGSDHQDSFTINLSEEDKLWAEQVKARVLERAKGKNVTATELRRQQISELLDAGFTASKVGAIMDASPRTIFKIVKLKKAGESLAPKFCGNSGRPRSARTEDFVAMATAVHAANPDVSVSKLAKKFKVSRKTVAKTLGCKN